MNSIPTNGTGTETGPGVAPPEGYEASADSMTSRGNTISWAAEDAQVEVDEVQPTELGEDEFGEAHGEHYASYSEAITQLGEGAVGMCTSIMSFAAQLSGTGTTYGSGEEAATRTVTQSGSDL